MLLQMIPIDRIIPTTPDVRLSKRRYKQYIAEVQKLGRLPHPCVVVAVGPDAYEMKYIHHGFDAARDVGLSEIECVVVSEDDDGELDQTSPNDHSCVALAAFLDAMRQQWQIALNKRLPIRNMPGAVFLDEEALDVILRYGKAAKRRRQFTGENRTVEVDRLTPEQIYEYTSLPFEFANFWLNAGGWLQDLEPFGPSKLVAKFVAETIEDVGLSDSIDTSRFRESVNYLYSVAEWWYEINCIENAVAYLYPVASRSLPRSVLDLVPSRVEACEIQFLITAEQWSEILDRCPKHSDHLEEWIRGAVLSVLEEPGKREAAFVSASVASLLSETPEWLTSADWLNLEEKILLARVLGVEQIVHRMVFETSQRLRERRDSQSEPTEHEPSILSLTCKCFEAEFHEAAMSEEQKEVITRFLAELCKGKSDLDAQLRT